MAGRIVVGTSSWADEGFVKHWYPKGLAARERLAWYAERFEAVELNSSFYAIPSRANVERWAETTPDGFSFDVKLHRLLSRHATKPNSLPPEMRGEVELNDRGNVIATPEVDRTLAVEFRHIGWMEGEQERRTLAELSERGAAYVCVDAPRERHVPIMPSVDAVTTKRLAYLRCHGRDADRYMRGRTVAERFDYDYKPKELREIGDRARELAKDADQVHVMFNNNARDLAPKAA